MSGVVLVTGGAGFGGGHLLEHLAGAADIVGWSRSPPGSAVAGLARWQQVDLTDRDAVRNAIRDLRPAAVYHLAGFPHVGASWHDAAQPLAVNALGTHHLLDALRRAGVAPRVLIVSSATVYAASDAALTEDHPVAPSTPYGRSKLAEEQLAVRAWAEDGIDVIVARAFNHTGPRQTPTFAAPSFARQIALAERRAAEPVIRVGNLDARRDISDVRDVVRAYAALMAHGSAGSVYNVASGVAVAMRALLEALIARARVDVRVETDHERLRPLDTPLVLGDATRLRRATAWHPEISLDRTLDDLLEYWRHAP